MWGVWQEQMEQVNKRSRTFSVYLLPRSSWIVLSACLMKEVENGSKPGLDCTFMFEMFSWTVVARVCMGGSSYTGACSLLRWKVVFMLLYLPPGPGGTAMSEGKICPDRNRSLSNWCRVGELDRPVLFWLHKLWLKMLITWLSRNRRNVRPFVRSRQLVHLWAASVNESNHFICLLFFILFFPQPAVSRVLLLQLSTRLVVFFVPSDTSFVFTARCVISRGHGKAQLHSARHMSCCHTSGISSKRNEI